MLERLVQAILLVQALHSSTILTPDIASDSVEDALVAIHTCDLALLLQLK